MTITSTQSLADYTVMITVDTQSLIPSKMNIDGSDIRFVDSLGTELSYWIETPTINTPTTRIWVKVPSISIGETTILMYYGNPGAGPASDGDETFEFFDDDWSQFTDGVGNPVHTAGQPWWEATVSYPVVFEDTSFPDRPRFHMLYDGHQVIGHAKGYAWSSDLNTWTEYDAGEPHPPNPNPIMGVGYTGNAQCAWGDVMKVGSTYYMYYSSGPGTGYRAESTDLINWINLQPIIDPTGTTTFGSGHAILKEGDGITPIVVDGRYWMVYFLAFGSGSMQLASSTDLLNWTPWVGNPLLTPTSGGWDQSGLWTPSFARLNDKYYIYYQGNGPAGWETGFASANAYDGGGTPISPDMVTWAKSDPDEDGNPDPVIRHGPPGSWDSDYVIDPMIREFDGIYYVFYTGNSANGYAYSDSPEGPWTKFGEEGEGPTDWLVTGTPTVSDGILTLPTSGTSITSTSTYLYHAIGYRANFVSGAKLSWGGFIDGSTYDRTMIGTERADSVLYLKNYVSSVLNAELSGSWLGDFHTYEILWQNGNSLGIVDHGATTTTLTSQVPSIALPVTFYNYDNSNPLHVDWIFVRQYADPEPTVTVGTEEIQPSPLAFSDGFEDGVPGNWDRRYQSGGTITQSSEQAHHESYSAVADVTSANGYGVVSETLSPLLSTAFMRCYVYFTAFPADGEQTCFLRSSGDSGAGVWATILAATVYSDGGTVKWAMVYEDVGDYRAIADTPLPQLNTWYCVEIKTLVDGASGEARMYVNDMEILTQTGLDNNAYGDVEYCVAGSTCLPLGTNGISTCYIDCVAVADTYIGTEEAPPPDETPPTYSNVGTNTTLAGQPCLFHAEWTDDTGLSGFYFNTNNTGVWVEDAWTPLTGLSDWSNVTKTLNPTPGVIVEYWFRCYDASNNEQITPIQQLIVTGPVKQLFSVSSNSTVSDIAFNAASKEITFTLEGPTGTTGNLSIFLSNRLVSDITGLTIYFDGDPKAYTDVPTDEGWLIHLTYQHSKHTVRIVLSTPSPAQTFIEPATLMAVCLVIALTAAFASTALRKKLTK